MRKPKTQLTRLQFEKLITGEWYSMKGDRYRKNGDFRTYVKEGFKYVSDGHALIRAKTWQELAIVLELL